MSIDVFVDFSRLNDDFDVRAAVARLAQPELLGSSSSRVTVAVSAEHAHWKIALPPDWTIRDAQAVDAFADAIAVAANDERPLLALIGDVQPSSAAIGLLLETIETDPMVGFACARLTGASAASLARLDGTGDRVIDELPRRLLAELPETYLVADSPARCLLIKPVVVANFADVERRFRSVAGALWHYIIRARRCGFRTLVCNSAVVTASWQRRSSQPCVITLTDLPEADRTLLRELFPDVQRTIRECGTGTAAASETRLARALPASYDTRPSLLLDVRNMVAGTNGTSIAALGICGGIHAAASGWDVTLLAARDASAFHELEESFPGWQVETKLPARQFTAALRLSQPWHIQEMIDLHDVAAYNVYFFLDTISWDAVYPAPKHLHGTWQFMAAHADALLFNSAFTRAQFRRRFAVPDDTPDLVAYHSFDPADYVRSDVRLSPDQEQFIFVVGNQYDHKDVARTTELLATAFPYESIVALGSVKPPTPRVRVLQSGTLTDAQIHRLYAGARLVVFPSFYEGFGFPILTTLSYGGTLVARESALLREIACRCAPRGRIVPFTRRDDLVEVVGRLLHGESVETVPLGTALENGRPMSWQHVAQGILGLLETLTADLTRTRWRSREHIIAQLMAAPTSLVDRELTRAGDGADRAVTA